MHGPSDAVCPSKASLHSDFSSDSFNPLHRPLREKQKEKFQSGTYWKNILYDRDNTVLTVRSLSKTALASKSFAFLWSSWRTPLLTDISYLLIEHLAAHCSLCWLAKPQRQLYLLMPQRTGRLISFIWSEQWLSCQNESRLMVAPKLVTFGKESVNSSNQQAIIFKKRKLKKIIILLLQPTKVWNFSL